MSVTNARATLTVTGVVSTNIGTVAGLTKAGLGRLELTNSSNTYSGGTQITGGTLSGNTIANAGSDSAFGRGNFSISNGATLEYTGSSSATNRTVNLDAGGGAISVTGPDLTMGGLISGTGGLTKQGRGHPRHQQPQQQLLRR